MKFICCLDEDLLPCLQNYFCPPPSTASGCCLFTPCTFKMALPLRMSYQISVVFSCFSDVQYLPGPPNPSCFAARHSSLLSSLYHFPPDLSPPLTSSSSLSPLNYSSHLSPPVTSHFLLSPLISSHLSLPLTSSNLSPPPQAHALCPHSALLTF